MSCKNKKCQHIVREQCDKDLCDEEILSKCVVINTDDLSCIDESDVELNLQDVLIEFCGKINNIEEILQEFSTTTIHATQVIIEPSDCIQESDIENMTLQDGLDAICQILTDIRQNINGLEECCEIDWLVSDSMDRPSAVTDDIYHIGLVAIGHNTPVFTLDVVGDLSIWDGDQLNLIIGGTVTNTQDSMPPNVMWFIGHADIGGSSDRTAIYGDEDQLWIYNKHNFGGDNPINQILLDNSNPTEPFIQLSSFLSGLGATQLLLKHDKLQINPFSGGGTGATGTFTSQDGKTVTVYRGIVIGIV